MIVLTLPNNVFVSKRERIMTFGTVEMTIAFSALLQCISGKKSRWRGWIYEFPTEFSNSVSYW